jgi:hypothetical protein
MMEVALLCPYFVSSEYGTTFESGYRLFHCSFTTDAESVGHINPSPIGRLATLQIAYKFNYIH